MEIKDDQVNKLGLHENNSKEKPQAQLYENIQDKGNLVSMEVDYGTLRSIFMKNGIFLNLIVIIII